VVGQFILGAAIALFVGMRLARHIDGTKGARADHKKAKTGLPGARKKAFDKTFAFVRFVAVLALVVIAAAYGLARQSG
jgi:hypothetical protein